MLSIPDLHRNEELALMRRRRTAADRALGVLVALGLLIGVPIYAVQKTGEALGWPVLIGGVVAFIAAVILLRVARARAVEAARTRQLEKRRNALLQKYGDPQLVERLLSGSVWQGQSAEQLRDSLGPPADMDERVMKKKTRQTWKYERRGVNRFALRITVEDGVVVGWENKT
jgi:hypothetical protein